MPCNRQFGCHGCVIEQAREKLWTLRQAIVQFLQVPAAKDEQVKVHALSLKKEIDELIASNYIENEKKGA